MGELGLSFHLIQQSAGLRLGLAAIVIGMLWGAIVWAIVLP